jgi:putative transposase
VKSSEHTEEEILGILREGENPDNTIRQVCRDHGISEGTYYRWRRKFQGMTVPKAKKLRRLEKENRRLKKLLAERDVEIDGLKELVRKNS